jgi:hypothetical protein
MHDHFAPNHVCTAFLKSLLIEQVGANRLASFLAQNFKKTHNAAGLGVDCDCASRTAENRHFCDPTHHYGAMLAGAFGGTEGAPMGRIG